MDRLPDARWLSSRKGLAIYPYEAPEDHTPFVAKSLDEATDWVENYAKEPIQTLRWFKPAMYDAEDGVCLITTRSGLRFAIHGLTDGTQVRNPPTKRDWGGAQSKICRTSMLSRWNDQRRSQERDPYNPESNSDRDT